MNCNNLSIGKRNNPNIGKRNLNMSVSNLHMNCSFQNTIKVGLSENIAVQGVSFSEFIANFAILCGSNPAMRATNQGWTKDKQSGIAGSAVVSRHLVAD